MIMIMKVIINEIIMKLNDNNNDNEIIIMIMM